MGPSSTADAALFLEMVCGTVALVRCLRFVVSMGPGSAAPAAALFLGWRRAANGLLDLVFAFCWFRSIGPAVPAAPLFFEIVCCNIARPWCLRLVSVIPALPVFRSSMLLVVRAYSCMFHSVSPYMITSTYDVLLRASLVLCVFFFFFHLSL
ncbi:hypothetical protein ARMGADRAFT_285477 [Armillaria gallica]|uniref:Uncharacterized protein n=1 Tax=Armillaria gallica TaxID=47427 RepID=A0A2H3DB42_ARMGA|nr:hypothetical protein ARMGADRAFT_285477 [Armillaria gallica]